jgi:glycosyltransferase involved in cell wall biosynthesis
MIIYIGNFYNAEIISERGIPFNNAAGNNRIWNIASAISLNGIDVEIISPGISTFSKPKSIGACKPRVEILNGISIYFARTIPIPFVNRLFATISIIQRIIVLTRLFRVDKIIVYNFDIEVLIVSVFLRCFTKIKIIHNVEDISLPKISDWRTDVEASAIQQLFFYLTMNVVAYISKGYIVPTKVFLKYLPKKSDFIIASGCQKIVDYSPTSNTKMKFLFSGKLEREHGVELLYNLLAKLDKSVFERIEVIVTGEGTKSSWLKNKLLSLHNSSIRFLGFVERQVYSEVLNSVDVCLVLQNPFGRYRELKTPSKFFEFYTSGKFVITTKVGDFQDLPKDSFLILDNYDPESLNKQINFCLENKNLVVLGQRKSYEYSKENFNSIIVGKNLKNKFLFE